MQEELIKLGFSSNQARVYLALTNLGHSTVGPIISKTKMPRQSVYNTLAELETKNLVYSTIKSGRANWQAKEPNQIIDNIKSQENIAKQILPGLLIRRASAKHLSDIKIYEGVDGFVSMHQVNIKQQKINTEVNIIGAAGQQWIDLMEQGRYLYKYENLRIKKKINHKIIAYENQRNEVKRFIGKYYLRQLPSERKKFKYLSKEYYSPVGIQTWQDRIELIIYSENPIVFEIKSLELTRSFEKHFKFLWNLAIN